LSVVGISVDSRNHPLVNSQLHVSLLVNVKISKDA